MQSNLYAIGPRVQGDLVGCGGELSCLALENPL